MLATSGERGTGEEMNGLGLGVKGGGEEGRGGGEEGREEMVWRRMVLTTRKSRGVKMNLERRQGVSRAGQ